MNADKQAVSQTLVVLFGLYYSLLQGFILSNYKGSLLTNRYPTGIMEYIGCGPLRVTVTIRIITFLVGDPYKPSFPTVTGRGPYPTNITNITRVLNHCSSRLKSACSTHGSACAGTGLTGGFSQKKTPFR